VPQKEFRRRWEVVAEVGWRKQCGVKASEVLQEQQMKVGRTRPTGHQGANLMKMDIPERSISRRQEG
jgi:hypothetical protein